MKIPKYIDKLIDRRARLAEELNSADFELCEWAVRNEAVLQILRFFRNGV